MQTFCLMLLSLLNIKQMGVHIAGILLITKLQLLDLDSWIISNFANGWRCGYQLGTKHNGPQRKTF